MALALCFGCGGRANASATAQADMTSRTPENEASAENRSNALGQPETEQEHPAEDIRETADKLWQAAEKNPQSPDAWNRAASALAIAAEKESDDDARIKRLRGALAGWERADSLAARQAKPSKRERPPLPPREATRLSVHERLLALIDPADVEVGRIAYQQGRIHWNYGHYKEATARFKVVVHRFPASAEAEYAAKLLLDSQLRQKDYEGLKQQVATMLKDKVLLKNRRELLDTLLAIRHQSGRQEALDLINSKNYPQCAKIFLALHERDKGIAIFKGDELLYNGSVCQERAGQIPQAIKTLKKLAKLYPQSGMAAQSIERANALEAVH